MNPAIVVMTILGCNDAGTDCHYIATAQERWPNIEMCNAVSEDHLPAYANQPYPVLIAVCQDPAVAGIPETAPLPTNRPASPKPPVAADVKATAQAPAAIQPPAAPQTTEQASAAQALDSEQADPVTEEEKQSLAGRAIQRVKTVLPTTEGIKTLMAKPVRLMEGGYSWVARKFDR
ncbi:hypothetical protein [Neorhizobium sp. NCHU2750]|uniref:hypothetical protein n=1 Tax=Neorhizobium sp. NCHU2750 TaxID=1825976 RepID=UPI000E74A497|nr:hypothetical protein NCHU2750_19100 [Neorhizobium sp. NCHU2750]